MHGGITEDGKSVLLIYGVDYGSRVAYLVNARGCTKREPPSDLALGYSGTVGQLSDDSEHLFYVRSGTAFGKNGEAKVVEAYSIRHLATARALTFGFGNGRHLLNVRLLRPLRVRDPIYMAIRTSGFGDGDDRRSSPPLVASSDRKLHRNFAGIGDEGGQRDPQVSISLDGAHMSAVDRDTAMIHHWDLQNPSLRPLGSVRLPGVKYGERRKWLIYGKETTMRDAIPRQIHHIRHSIQGKVVTVVTASASSVVVNVLLTFNLQLIYHQTVQIPPWPAFVPVRIGFCDSAVLNLFAISPIEAASMQPGIGRLSGLTGIHVSFREIGESIREIESYFDSTIDRVESLKKAVYRNDASPEYRYGWTPGVMDRDDDAAISPEVDTPHDSVAEDDRRQRALYETVFGSTDKYAGRTATAQSRRFLVPLLLSFTYSWAPDERVSVFGVVLRYQYSILAVGPTSRKSGQKSEITRVLYTSDVNTGIDHKQHLEFYKSGSTYIMRVFRMNDSIGVYSGAPLPLPRWTIMSPHFLPEDAWYDTFIVKEAAHGTMPDGQMMTPNPVLIYSTSVSAYFEPNTFAIQDIVDYGHRARSGYVIPKFLLWREYGLRGGRPHHPNELLFGGGRWADAMGAHFLSIYDDKTYDDSWPLVPSTFAMACNSDHCAQQTTHVDAFFRRLHQDEERLLDNSRAVSCVLPLACRARPMATLSLMRHITLTSHNVNDIGCVEIKTGATKPRSSKYEGKWGRWRRDLEDLWYAFVAPWIPSHGTHSEPHTSEVTLPLPGFCSFQHRLYKTPPVSATTMWRDDSVWACIRATLPPPNPNWGAQDAWLIESVRASARGPTSPFTRLVEEILDMKDRQTRLSFLRVVWLEKLLAWKVKTFGLHVYLVRSALPMMILFCVHLTLGLLLTGQEADGSRQRTVPVLLLASVEASVSCFIFYVKMRQLYRIPSLFVRSIFNYVDTTAVLLGFATFIQVIRNTARVRSFLAFSTLAIWIATILMLRIFRPVGMLLLLLMETLQGIFSYLVLLSFIILGFAFVPFLLFRNLHLDSARTHPFSSFPLSINQMLIFISSDYGALEPSQGSSAAVRTLRALFVIVVTILLLNTLIALLNLKIKTADKNAANLYHLQMASLQVEIELGLLSSSQRARGDWFPDWFSYSMTETEKRVWRGYLDKNPLKWTEENSFDERDDHVAQTPIEAGVGESDQDWHTTSSTSVNNASGTDILAASSPATEPKSQESKSPRGRSPRSSNVAAGSSFADSSSATAKPNVAANPSVGASAGSSKTSMRQEETRDSSRRRSFSSDDDVFATSHDAVGLSDTTTFAFRVNESFAETVSEDVSITSQQAILCQVCNKLGTRCTGCLKVAYCSKEHQKEDWHRHRRACKGKSKVQ